MHKQCVWVLHLQSVAPSHPHPPTHPHKHTHPYTHTPTHTHTHTYIHTHTHRHTQTHTHTDTHTDTHTHKRTHTHKHTHTITLDHHTCAGRACRSTSQAHVQRAGKCHVASVCHWGDHQAWLSSEVLPPICVPAQQRCVVVSECHVAQI